MNKKKGATRNVRKPARRKRVDPESALPDWLLEKYPGKHIIYSHEADRVIGVGQTYDEACDQAEASGVKGQWHHAYADSPGEYRY
jgi:hypothetical protein